MPTKRKFIRLMMQGKSFYKLKKSKGFQKIHLIITKKHLTILSDFGEKKQSYLPLLFVCLGFLRFAFDCKKEMTGLLQSKREYLSCLVHILTWYLLGIIIFFIINRCQNLKLLTLFNRYDSIKVLIGVETYIHK